MLEVWCNFHQHYSEFYVFNYKGLEFKVSLYVSFIEKVHERSVAHGWDEQQ